MKEVEDLGDEAIIPIMTITITEDITGAIMEEVAEAEEDGEMTTADVLGLAMEVVVTAATMEAVEHSMCFTKGERL